MNWAEEREIIVETKTGKYRKVEPYYFNGVGLDPGWVWLKDLSKTDILDLWAKYREDENHIVY